MVFTLPKDKYKGKAGKKRLLQPICSFILIKRREKKKKVKKDNLIRLPYPADGSQPVINRLPDLSFSDFGFCLIEIYLDLTIRHL